MLKKLVLISTLLIAGNASALSFGKFIVNTISARNNGDIAITVCKPEDTICRTTNKNRSTLIIPENAPGRANQYTIVLMAVSLDIPIIVATTYPVNPNDTEEVYQVGIKP